MAKATHGRTTVLLVAIAALLTGCSPDAPAGPFPPRPADIDTTSVDLCAALTTEQQDELGVEAGEPDSAELGDGPTRLCGWSNYRNGYNYSVQTTPVPAAVAVGTPDSTVQEIDGYGVVQVTANETSAPLCTYYVDTSDNLGLRTLTQLTGRDMRNESGAIEEVCQRAKAFTTQVIQNLRPAE
ncbi:MULTISPECIES: DUF3558 family protein [Pseudonocardia]|uniref:DUF3558 domain-containing protein n=2 Tax=Pseudonocardia TaxID=1847 RepID=A0A1Y2N7M0_PSEAH|nr:MULTISPECIES: DUF3558 family protein [Pseudonocardia]OSY43462.1 hypothetical protein BG845_00405 [Pseudonocardia autotrophica]TDN73544.1 uncharacterized protein DUF3558 [Pseudonocardia autotrophica]BBG04287.1 hypothetical protein Pdca_54960 [Pseudonocardia autotrophica]GEC25570.1 hypothetical protein PSA01_25990 [Pseudonocardia saturnea]